MGGGSLHELRLADRCDCSPMAQTKGGRAMAEQRQQHDKRVSD